MHSGSNVRGGTAFWSTEKAWLCGVFFQTRYDSSWQFAQASLPT